MKTINFKKISIILVLLLFISLVTFLIIYFNNYSYNKKIERVKKSNIQFLGNDDKGNYIYMGNDAKTYTFSG